MWHSGLGEQYGPAEVKLHVSVASDHGRMSATEDWCKTGRPRMAVAKHQGKHVLVRSVFRSRTAHGERYQELAWVSPLKVIPSSAAAGCEPGAVWLDLGLVLLGRAGEDRLVRVGGLAGVRGHATPVWGWGGVLSQR